MILVITFLINTPSQPFVLRIKSQPLDDDEVPLFMSFCCWHRGGTKVVVSFGLKLKKTWSVAPKSSERIMETSRKLQRKGNNCRWGGVLFKTQMNSTMLINSYGLFHAAKSQTMVFFLYEEKQNIIQHGNQ